jgi:hypothetical protein
MVQGAFKEIASMRTLIAVFAIALVAASAPGLVPQAAAAHDDDFEFAAGIRLGPFHASIGLAPHGHYYYRTRDRVHYDDYRCTDRCYRRGSSTYHHERCPAMLHLLYLQRLHPHEIFAYHAPRYDGRFARFDHVRWNDSYRHGRDYWSRDRDRYDRRGRYEDDRRWDRRDDRRWDRRDDRRWDRRNDRHRGRGRGHDRDRGHRHGPHCRH